MTKIQYEIDIDAPVKQVYEYYTNPDNIKEAWPRDIVKESRAISGENNEEGAEMKVKGEYMGKEDEMTLEVTDKKDNKKLVTEQTEGPFKRWKSIQEFNGQENATHVRHTIEYELPTSGKIVNFLSSSGADSKIEEGLHQAANAVKQKLESA